MRVLEKHIMFDEDEMRQGLEIEVDGTTKFSVSDGEPEDANLSRDFGSCYNITSLMRLAYEAGKAGEDFLLARQEIDGKDGW